MTKIMTDEMIAEFLKTTPTSTRDFRKKWDAWVDTLEEYVPPQRHDDKATRELLISRIGEETYHEKIKEMRADGIVLSDHIEDVKDTDGR